MGWLYIYNSILENLFHKIQIYIYLSLYVASYTQVLLIHKVLNTYLT